jgi:hypothetical protein
MSALLLVYASSLVLVLWAVTDMARRPAHELAPRAKAGWIIGTLVGWLVFGVAGAIVAVVYLVGPRRRLNAARWL